MALICAPRRGGRVRRALDPLRVHANGRSVRVQLPSDHVRALPRARARALNKAWSGRVLGIVRRTPEELLWGCRAAAELRKRAYASYYPFRSDFARTPHPPESST